MKTPTHYFIFDVESLGLHGEGFAVAGGIWQADGLNVKEFAWHCQSEEAGAPRPRRKEDLEWVRANVTIHPTSKGYFAPEDVRRNFWSTWMTAKEEHPGIVMAAECLWPVEGRFLSDCVKDDIGSRNWEGPYPIHEIASFMLAAGMDPMATYERQRNELPAHEPLADARLSARLLFTALRKLQSLTPASENP